MLNHSCPGSVLQEGQALQNSNLMVGMQTLIIQQLLYKAFLEGTLFPVFRHLC